MADEVSPLAQERQVSITVNASPSTLWGNKHLLHRALFNLMENAVKYSEAGGTVAAAVRCENGWQTAPHSGQPVCFALHNLEQFLCLGGLEAIFLSEQPDPKPAGYDCDSGNRAFPD